jgi:hypothetical protein
MEEINITSSLKLNKSRAVTSVRQMPGEDSTYSWTCG